MCGIIATFHPEKSVVPEILEGLSRLEYRGYDSAGLAILSEKRIEVAKCTGRVNELKNLAQSLNAKIGIGHTRWATHGKVSTQNAHPHATARVALVHNGILENHEALRSDLKDVEWRSESDTEVALHWVDRELAKGKSPREALHSLARRIEGGSSLVFLFAQEPQTIYAIQKGAPLVIGRKKLSRQLTLASDSNAFNALYDKILVVPQGCIVQMSPSQVELEDLSVRKLSVELTTYSEEARTELNTIQHAHYMHQEIHEQPQVLRRIAGKSIDGASFDLNEKLIGVSGLNLGKINHVHLVGCGTSFHAALLAKSYLETALRVPVTAELASEFRYEDRVISPKTLLIALSQSGETADTLRCVEKAAAAGSQIVSVTNRSFAAIPRLATKAIHIDCGQEVSVAATKSFTAMIACLYLFSLSCARNRGLITKSELNEKLQALMRTPQQIESLLAREPEIADVARRLSTPDTRSILFVGRRYAYPAALEGALKLKELSYIHAEAVAAGELKHGSLALVDPHTPVIAIAPRDAQRSKMMATVKEITARSGRVIGLGAEEDAELRASCADYIAVPESTPELNPMLESVVLQLVAYHSALERKTDIDRPRNLAKSVTVE